MHWFEISTEKLVLSHKSNKFYNNLINALNIKYGNYDYKQDLRTHFRKDFEQKFLEFFPKAINNKNIILCGSNCGVELQYFSNHDQIVALDLSSKALEKLKTNYPNVKTIQSDIVNIPFDNTYFDIYIALRTVHSRYVDLYSTLEESLRVTKSKGVIILSIANGYLIGDKVVRGLYDIRTKLMDLELPYKLSSQICTFYNERGCSVKINDTSSEILLFIQK